MSGSPTSAASADDLRDLFSHAHHLQQRLARHALDGVVPAREGLHELELPGDALAHFRGRLGVVLELGDTFAQERERGIDLAALTPLDDHADDLPGIALGGEEIAAIAERVGDLNE